MSEIQPYENTGFTTLQLRQNQALFTICGNTLLFPYAAYVQVPDNKYSGKNCSVLEVNLQTGGRACRRQRWMLVSGAPSPSGTYWHIVGCRANIQAHKAYRCRDLVGTDQHDKEKEGESEAAETDSLLYFWAQARWRQVLHAHHV